MQQKIDETLRAHGAASWGAVRIERLYSFAPQGSRLEARLRTLAEPHVSALVMAFPYYAGRQPGNVPLYARGLDYYEAGRARLTAMAAALPELSARVLPDGYPLPAVSAARLCGCAMTGAMGLAICPPYGSFVTLGALATPIELEETPPAGFCERCGACAAACPTGALRLEGETRRYDRRLCLSSISQKKGALEDAERALLARAPTIWGCDLCQLACPHNADPAYSPLPESRADYTPHLAPDAPIPPGHSFSRSEALLRRNLGLINK